MLDALKGTILQLCENHKQLPGGWGPIPDAGFGDGLFFREPAKFGDMD